MNLKGMQAHQLLAALGACLAAMLVAGPAAARPFDEGGSSNQTVSEEQSGSVSWYLTDEYRPFMLPEAEANRVVNQRQLELAADKAGQAWEVIPYLSHGVLTESDAAGLAASQVTPDGYQPQLGVSQSGIPLSAGIPEPGELIVPGMPELGVFGDSTSEIVSLGSRNDRPDGFQPQLGVSEFSVVADDGFDWQTTGLAASIMAALLVALAITFTRGNRHGYRSA